MNGRRLNTGEAVYAVLQAGPDLPWRTLADIVHTLATQGVYLVSLDGGTPATEDPTPVPQPAPFLKDDEGDTWAHIGGGQYMLAVRKGGRPAPLIMPRAAIAENFGTAYEVVQDLHSPTGWRRT